MTTVDTVRRVAVVVDRLLDYQIPLIRGMASGLKDSGAGLLVVVSHPLDRRSGAMIGRMVRAGCFDAVAVTGMTDMSTGLSRIAESVGFARAVPCVTLGVRVPGVPAILPDNAHAMRSLMTHLLEQGCRTAPVFVAGPQDNDDSREREAAFRAVALEHGLTLPPDPVAYAGFERERAYRWTVARLAAGRDFDAVVAANDDMAIGVLNALHEYGVQVPREVAVVGFDNTVEARHAEPPLSSVDARLDEQGQIAARLLLDQLGGRSVADQVRVSAPLLVRESSLVTGSSLVGAIAEPADPEHAEQAAVVDATDAKDIVEQVVAALPPVAGTPSIDLRTRLQTLVTDWLSKVLDAALTSDDATVLRKSLDELVVAHPEPTWWHHLGTTLRAGLNQVYATQVPDFVEVALLRAALHIDRTLAAARQQQDRDQMSVAQHVLELNQALSECRSLADLTREVSAYLPRLHVRRCFVVLFEGPLDWQPDDANSPARADREGSAPARVLLDYRDGARRPDPDPMLFQINDLLPPSMADELNHGVLAVQPLFSDTRWFGLLMHEQSTADQRTGEALRRDTSSVLDAITRAGELKELVGERTTQLEEEILRRTTAQEELRLANIDLRRALLVDGLTGLQNRPSFDEHLARMWHRHARSGDPLSVLMVDVDHFKLYNDTYGHLAGDECLRRVAACLQAAVVRNEDVVARYGGEEFALILPVTTLEGARLVARRLLRRIRTAAIPHAGSSSPRHFLSVSIGIGTTENVGIDSMEKLLDVADRALYAAKRNGRDRAMERVDGPEPDVFR